MFGLEYLDYCLLNACGAHRIALTGEGIVDGQGAPPEAVNEEKGPGGNGPPVN